MANLDIARSRLVQTSEWQTGLLAGSKTVTLFLSYAAANIYIFTTQIVQTNIVIFIESLQKEKHFT